MVAETPREGEKGFAADDARLGAMHGYAAQGPAVDVMRLREGPSRPDEVGAALTCPTCRRPHVMSVGLMPNPVAEGLGRLEGKVDGLETLLRQVIVALRSGAVGKWS